ncbi:MAG: hypothetical protein AAF551_05765, partial [Bacteroidota bacterium]
MKLAFTCLTLAIVLFQSCTPNERTPEKKIQGLNHNPNAISVNSIAPDRGLADPHVLIVGDTIYAMCGHDRDWNIVDFCRMDRWELWSST